MRSLFFLIFISSFLYCCQSTGNENKSTQDASKDPVKASMIEDKEDEDEDNKILNFVSQEGDNFQLEVKIAKMSGLAAIMISDDDDDDDDDKQENIPIPNVKTVILEKVLIYKPSANPILEKVLILTDQAFWYGT